MESNHTKELHTSNYPTTNTTTVDNYQEQTDSKGVAHAFLHSNATHEEIEEELKHIHKHHLNGDPNIKYTVTSNPYNEIPIDESNPELTDYIQDQLDKSNYSGEKKFNYGVEITYSKGTHEEAAQIGEYFMHGVHKSPHHDENDSFHCEIVHRHTDGNYTHRE